MTVTGIYLFEMSDFSLNVLLFSHIPFLSLDLLDCSAPNICPFSL